MGRGKEKERERERDGGKEKEREREKDGGKEKERERERDGGKEKERERERDGGKEKGRKRKHSHHRREEESSDATETSSAGSSDTDSGLSESETESSSTSEEERERRRKKKEKKKQRRSSDGSSKHKSRAKKERKKHSKQSKAKRKKSNEDISMDDYFRKSVEFRTWLSEERSIFFSDLTSDKSRLLFKKFVNKWNDQLLKKKYYQDLQSSALEHGKQTGHVWKFSKSVSQDELAGVKESVSSWTVAGSDEAGGGGGASAIGPRPPPSPTTSGVMIGPMIGPRPGPSVAQATHSDPYVREEQRRVETERERSGRREMRKHNEMVMEELVPKATGREARLEKKKMHAEKRRNREISPDVAESTLMGPKTNIQAKIRNRQEQRHSRALAAADKVAEIQAKEKSKMQALLEMAKANKKEGSLWC